MPPILLVALGGAAGSAARYALSSILNPVAPTGPLPASVSPWSVFPIGTLVINLIGCALIGLIAGWLGSSAGTGNTPNAAWKPLLIAGVLGGFTTFSAFGMESVLMFRAGAVLPATIYVVGSTALGITLAAAGYAVTLRT